MWNLKICVDPEELCGTGRVMWNLKSYVEPEALIGPVPEYPVISNAKMAKQTENTSALLHIRRTP
jgi:hypothetical protein